MFKFSMRAAILASISLIAAIMAGVPAANADNDLVMVSISDALATQDAKELDGSVKFYFGESAHPAVLQTIGNYVTTERANGFGRSATTACERALVSALLKFQHRAQQLGANAVINIHSYYRKRDFSSETQIQCYDGFLMSGLSLKGDFVKTP